MLVQLNNILKYYGQQTVLEDLNFALHAGERVALVGRNGSGKSTVLKLITGEEDPTFGDVRRAQGTTIGMLRQDPDFDPEDTIHSVLDSAFHELDGLEEQLEHLQSKLGGATEQDFQAYHDLLEHYQLRGGYERRSRRDAVLLNFGFRGREFERVGSLSGGEKTRLGLAKLLVSNPEVLLLDEPTNHLDIKMLEWLEGFLSRYAGAILVVSHDRAFLDNVTSKTAYIRDRNLKVYTGNYSHFKQQLEAELEHQLKVFEAQQRKIDAFKDSVELNRVWARKNSQLFKRVHAMEKRLERMQAAQVDAPPPDEEVTEVSFKCSDSGEVVLDARHLSKNFAGRQLFKDVNVHIRKGEKIALIGMNGAGKSTFLKALLGLLNSDDSRSTVKSGARVRVGYYDQQLRGVDPESTLYDEVRALVEKDQEAHNLLGAYMFPYDAQTKQVKNLSGGERARLALLKLSLQQYNFLVLDEPTNHLDMEMVESLEEALKEYPGTLLMVSHDRRFIENLSDQIWLLEDGQYYSYPGGYQYYRQKHVVSQKTEEVKVKVKRERSGPSLWHLKRKLEQTEQDIHDTESKQQKAAEALDQANPDADFAMLGKALADLEHQLLQLMDQWENLSTQIAELEA
ncbi:ABC-F family ATP-binding cassette domain-containing protein [Deinococcus roseus]|uniref:ABC-F family ATP-binding cassette domain-containing protein n=1 Tax=Deinococcus roseus TaxID=392414 RepID=UPI0016635D37|nr:ABC-F family ATP-binding cassette domain-containing protein [Deinococcus roseus]